MATRLRALLRGAMHFRMTFERAALRGERERERQTDRDRDRDRDRERKARARE